jgi:hypothetical protein
MRRLARERECPANVLLAVVAEIVSTDGDPSALGVEEPEQEVRHGRLARPARADQRDVASRLQDEVEVAERRPRRTVVPRGHAFQPDRGPGTGWRERVGGIAHIGLAVDELQHPATCRQRPRQLAGGFRERGDCFERGDREESERRD